MSENIMTRYILVIPFLLLFFSQLCFSQANTNDDNLRDIVRKYKQAEVTIPMKDSAFVDFLTREVSIRSIINNSIHINLSSLTVEWFINQNFNYSIIERNDNKGLVTARNLARATEWSSYPTYSQYVSIMQSFALQYPSLCRLDTIGVSIYGKLILALKISDNATVDEDEPEVFYSSTIHGDETGGFVVMLHLADYLLKNYSSDTRVKNIIDKMEVWINPLANPDGTYGTGNIINYPTRENARGYDLNRNFPDPEVNSVMQKETLEMVDFLQKHKFVLSANFHSGVEVVNFPWDRWPRLHPDNNWFNAISRKYADTVHSHSPATYMTFEDNGVTNGYAWYPVYGGRQDYVTYELQGREVTIELDNANGDDYVTPASDLILLWQYNYRSLLGYLENALYGIHGLVIDANTLAPVYAKVEVQKHDTVEDNSYVYSDKTTGRFVRLLYPGTWDLTFSADGYNNVEVRNVNVDDQQTTTLLVKMGNATEIQDLKIFPNPVQSSDGHIDAILPDKLEGKVNVRIFNISGILYSDYDFTYQQKERTSIDIRNFDSGIYIIIFRNIATNTSARSRFVVINR
jgi:hypothetical protein